MEKVFVALIVGLCIGLFLAPLTHLDKRTGSHVIQSVSACPLDKEMLKRGHCVCVDTSGNFSDAGRAC